jgi:hypothetical protein
MKDLNRKSLLVGLALGAGAIFALGQNAGSSNQVGRYQIAGAGGDGNKIFLIIDTTTGAAKLLSGGGVSLEVGVPFDQVKPRRP